MKHTLRVPLPNIRPAKAVLSMSDKRVSFVELSHPSCLHSGLSLHVCTRQEDFLAPGLILGIIAEAFIDDVHYSTIVKL